MSPQPIVGRAVWKHDTTQVGIAAASLEQSGGAVLHDTDGCVGVANPPVSDVDAGEEV